MLPGGSGTPRSGFLGLLGILKLHPEGCPHFTRRRAWRPLESKAQGGAAVATRKDDRGLRRPREPGRGKARGEGRKDGDLQGPGALCPRGERLVGFASLLPSLPPPRPAHGPSVPSALTQTRLPGAHRAGLPGRRGGRVPRHRPPVATEDARPAAELELRLTSFSTEIFSEEEAGKRRIHPPVSTPPAGSVYPERPLGRHRQGAWRVVGSHSALRALAPLGGGDGLTSLLPGSRPLPSSPLPALLLPVIPARPPEAGLIIMAFSQMLINVPFHEQSVSTFLLERT